MKKQYMYIGGLFLAIMAYVIIRKQIKSRQAEETLKRIREGFDSSESTIKSILRNIDPATNYDASHLVFKIKDAKGTFNDDEEMIYTTLSGLSKPELKSLYQTFSNKHGDLDQFLMSFLDEKEYNKAIQIVKSA